MTQSFSDLLDKKNHLGEHKWFEGVTLFRDGNYEQTWFSASTVLILEMMRAHGITRFNWRKQDVFAKLDQHASYEEVFDSLAADFSGRVVKCDHVISRLNKDLVNSGSCTNKVKLTYDVKNGLLTMLENWMSDVCSTNVVKK